MSVHTDGSTKSDKAILAELEKQIGKALDHQSDDTGRLFYLDLSGYSLTALPPEIGQLTALEELDLVDNQLTLLPPEIAKLTALRGLDLSGNQLTQLPPEIAKLTALRRLDLSGNQLTQLPPEIAKLTALSQLNLSGNLLTQLPSEIGQLTFLYELNLADNQFAQLPQEITKLTILSALNLNNNQFTQLPLEIIKHNCLVILRISNNQLTQLPPETAHLTELMDLRLDGNPHLTSPPPEIVTKGMRAIRAFLWELLDDGYSRYEAKLLIVGEGGTGKSSLLAALRGEPFDKERSTTHGIEVDQIELTHPDQNLPEQKITLNTWDFGGQDIYHATHQLFLTKRSLYVVVWNARLGVEQGRLSYWLNTITALAPDAPILLVATHIDERPADINYTALKTAFPQLAGNLSVSSAENTGIDELLAALQMQAATLPLMGQPWPRSWRNVETRLLTEDKHHIHIERYADLCEETGVDRDLARGSFGAVLNDLGKILYFQDDPVLSGLVVLKPNWITKAISRVLTDEATRDNNGILSHADLPRIWNCDEDGHTYGQQLYPVFLRMMERFDLSYQIEADTPTEHPTRSLIPQLLPHQQPENLPTPPPSVTPDNARVEMVYRLNFVPPGVMSWFIVRTHRYTQNLHWRDGAALQYEGHQARIELNADLREVRITVWGPSPYNFFTILKNTWDLILARFEGLKPKRDVPCICHTAKPDATPCPHFFSYDSLVERLTAGKASVECDKYPYDQVSVRTMLFGIHESTQDQVLGELHKANETLAELKTGQEELLEQNAVLIQQSAQYTEQLIRYFTREWNTQMKKLEVECPNTFVLQHGKSGSLDPKKLVRQEFGLRLVCQHPPGPHMVGEPYALNESAEWWAKMHPWLNKATGFLKLAVPIGFATAGLVVGADLETIKYQTKFMEELTKALPEIPEFREMEGFSEHKMGSRIDAEGEALRTLHAFLTKADAQCEWRDLKKTPTPDGNILWLCAEHRAQYEAKPLYLETTVLSE